MADSKYVVFNCSRGPITITLYRQSDLRELEKHASYKRRKLARDVFKTVVVQSNSSKDLVAETGICIEELEQNKELQHLIRINKFRIVLNTEKPKPEPKPVVILEVAEEVVDDVSEEEEPGIEISDFIEEVVDPEELKHVLIKESDIVDRGDEEEEEVVAEKPKTSKKRGRKPNKTRK